MKRTHLIRLAVNLAVIVLTSTLPLTGCASSETANVPSGESSLPSSEKVIKGLAYIGTLVLPYNDGADPEEEGLALGIGYYNAKGEGITFQHIPVTVTIELYGYRDASDAFDHEKMELVYQQQVTIDHSPREILDIFIPFENVMIDHNKYYEFGTMKVTVTTPEQGNFRDVLDLVELYPAEIIIAPPQGATPPPAPSAGVVIEGLARIGVLTVPYTDDPDDPNAKEKGLSLGISFRDSEGEYIDFQNIPVTVAIELYGYGEASEAFDHEKMELVYQQQVLIDRSPLVSEILGGRIRIPFENIMVDQNKYYEYGTLKVTVTTPEQGDFQDTQDFVRLYPED